MCLERDPLTPSPEGSDKPSGASKSHSSSSSSSSDAQDSVGVSHGFLSLGVDLGGISSTSSDMSSCPFHRHGSDHFPFLLGSCEKCGARWQLNRKQTLAACKWCVWWRREMMVCFTCRKSSVGDRLSSGQNGATRALAVPTVGKP